jgi:hypothetical protein
MRARQLALVSTLVVIATTLGSTVLAAPAQAATRKAATTGVAGDLTGNGRPELLLEAQGFGILTTYSSVAAPFTASTAAASPTGDSWDNYQVSHRGSMTGGSTDDLLAFDTHTHTVYVYPNDAQSGGTAGHFTNPAKAFTVAKPATCAAGSDCTGYNPTWNSATQVLATDGIDNADGVPDVITVENGKLWYYPGHTGGVLGNPVLLGDGNWSGTTLVAPGKVGGVPTLWVRDNSVNGAMTSFPLAFNADGTPTALLHPSVPQLIQTALATPNGVPGCLGETRTNGSTTLLGSYPCTSTKATDLGWEFGTDGTAHEGGQCLDATTGLLTVCDGRDSQHHWQFTAAGTLLDTASGKCLALPSVSTFVAPAMAACDGSTGQHWTIVGGAQPVQLPLLPGAYTTPSTEQAMLTSPGDIDGTGNPALVAFALDRGQEYPGLAPAGGLARFAATPRPLGSPMPTLVSPGTGALPYFQANAWTGGDAWYGNCGKLALQQDGDLVYSDYRNKVLWSAGTAGHPWDGTTVTGGSGPAVTGSTGEVYWSSGAPDPVSIALDPDCQVLIKDSNGTPVWSSHTYNPAGDQSGHPLMPGTTLHAGEAAAASSGTRLVQQPGGDLQLLSATGGRVLWATGTDGNPGAYATMQADGNFVLYAADGHPLWSAGTYGVTSAHVTVRNDDTLAVINATDAVQWSTGTAPTGVNSQGTPLASGTGMKAGDTLESKLVRLTMQADGNLVIYSKTTGDPLWSSNTYGNSGARAAMQADGNLVVYAADGHPIWASGTSGHPSAHLVVQDDANVVLYDTTGHPLWASGTMWSDPTLRGKAFTAGTNLTGPLQLPMGSLAVPSGDLEVRTSNGTLRWASNTSGSNVYGTMQDDGNFVLYDGNHNPIWSTSTWGHPGAVAVFQYDLNFVIYDRDGRPIWASHSNI